MRVYVVDRIYKRNLAIDELFNTNVLLLIHYIDLTLFILKTNNNIELFMYKINRVKSIQWINNRIFVLNLEVPTVVPL